MVHHAGVVEALGMGRLKLTLGNGLNTRPNDLGHVGSGVYPQGNHAGYQDSQALPGKCQSVIQETQLKQQRRILNQFHIDTGDAPQNFIAAGCHQAKDNSQCKRQNQGKKGGLHRIEQSQQKCAAVGPHLGPRFGAEQSRHTPHLLQK